MPRRSDMVSHTVREDATREPSQEVQDEPEAKATPFDTAGLRPAVVQHKIQATIEQNVEAARQRLQQAPNDLQAACGLAEGAYMLRRYKLAEYAARLAIDINPARHKSYHTLYRILRESGSAERFQDFISEICETAPNIGVAKTSWFGDKQEKAIVAGMPAIQVSSTTRSASSTIMRSLQEVLGIPHIRVVFPETPQRGQRGRRRILKGPYERFARGGAMVKEHLWPLKENLDLMEQIGCTRLVVHFRDPRQHLVSNARASEVRNKDRANLQDSEDLVSLIDARIEGHFETWMWWLSEWVKNAKESGGNFDILFTTFEEFKADQRKLISKILAFYGVDPDLAGQLDLSRTTRHFRKGSNEEWRTVMTPAQQERCWELMPDLLKDRFGWTP